MFGIHRKKLAAGLRQGDDGITLQRTAVFAMTAMVV
jgi:hypothetical protein